MSQIPFLVLKSTLVLLSVLFSTSSTFQYFQFFYFFSLFVQCGTTFITLGLVLLPRSSVISLPTPQKFVHLTIRDNVIYFLLVLGCFWHLEIFVVCLGSPSPSSLFDLKEDKAFGIFTPLHTFCIGVWKSHGLGVFVFQTFSAEHLTLFLIQGNNLWIYYLVIWLFWI